MPQPNPGSGRSASLPRVGAAAFLVAFLATASCSPGFNQPVREVTARTGTDGVQRAEIIAHSFWYEPNRVVVKSGVPVELRIHNASWIIPHGFSCIAPDAGLETKQSIGLIGRNKDVRFTPKEPGEYPFFCQIRDHAKKGMKGTLVVQK